MLKHVNGVEVEMTPEEIAEWEAVQAAYIPPEEPVQKTPQEKLTAFLAANPDVLEMISND